MGNMKKSDNRMKVCSVIVILAIIVSVFGGVVSAVDVSEDFTGSVADAKIQAAFAEDKIQSLSSQTEIFVGQGFDKCEIPTLSQMQNWITNSPYGAVNLYIGGSCRSCPNSALTASYVSQLSQQGWKFIPTWVGPQSACWVGSCGSRISNDPATAYNQGISEANAAIDVAIDLGLALADGSGTIIYYDLENYDTTNTACRNAAKSFISGWTAQLHARGSEAGVYGSSCGSEISDFASISNVPDAIWPAHWIYSSYNSGATVWDVACLSNGLWANHQRIRQYAGGHGETWGGVTLNIDCNVIDGIVASVGPADIIPLTGDMYGNGKDITGFYNANTAEFTFGGETARYGQMADKTIMSESSTDTTGTYYASKAGLSFDGKTDGNVNIEFADQSAELGVVNLRGLSFGTQVGEYNGVIAYSNYENDYASWIYNFVDGYNTGMKWQCVEYVNRYYKAIYGMEIRIPGTNAEDYYGTASARGVIAYPNGGTTSPQPGDILCSDGGSYGHVAIVREVTTGSIHVIHQNWANTGADNDKIISMSISGGHYTVSGFSGSYPVQGWLRKPSGSTKIPLTGDMYRSGTDTTGIYNTGTAEFTIGGKTVRFGQTNDEPIIGDWDGDGYDEIGLFRSSTSMFYLVTRNWATLPYEVGAADKDIPFSYPEDIPIAGDWDGDGDDDIGGYYPGTFYLYLLNLGSSTATSYRDVPFGQADDIPLIGDWDNDGDDDVAVCRKYDLHDNPTYYFDLDLTGVDHEIGPCEWGDNDDIPITGRWNAGSGDKIGVYRPSTEEFIRNYDIPQIQECEGTDTSCGIYPNCGNCNEDDGCYPYGNGCEERNYYCISNEAGCDYTYSNRHTDAWVDTGNTRWEDENECKEKEQKEQEYKDYACSGSSCTYSVTNTQWIDTGNTRNKDDGTDCGSDYYDDWVNYCKGDELWKHKLFHDFYCDGGECTDHTSWVDDQLVWNCNDFEGWFEAGNIRWVDDPGNECQEKEQKEFEYRDFTCSGDACTYSVTDTQWTDTGNTRNKPDGTICGCTASNTLKKCNGGICTDTGICDSTNCDADAACDGKEPGDSCGDGICNSTCKCVSACGNMAVDPTSWSPTINCGESDNEIVTVSATGGIVEGVTVSKESGPTWLSVSPANLGDVPSGSSKTFTMTASPPAGTSGDFTYTIRVSNTCGTPSSRDVTGTITVYCPELSYSPESHDFGDMCEGVTDSTTFEIWNSGTGTLTYTLSESCGWVDVNPAGGSSTGEHDTITVEIDTTGLSEGTHTGDITINSNGESGTFTVTVNVVPCEEPVLSYLPTSHDFGDMCAGVTDSTTFEIWNSRTGTLTYTLSESCGWVDVNPASGSSTGEHDTITVEIDTTGLSEGLHTCDISIGSNGGSGTFTVTVNVVPCPETVVSIEDASAPQGGTVTVPINIAGVENMCGASIWLNYNKDVVIVDSVSDGDLVPLTHSIDNPAGVTKINWDTTSGMTGDFVFAYVTLKAVGNQGDTCLLDLDVKELYDCVPPFNEIPRTVVDGTFEVIPPRMEGDVTDLNVCVSLKDSTLIKFYLVDMATLTPDQLECADTNDDGEATLKDSTAIKFWLVDPDFPLWESPADDHMMEPVPCSVVSLARSAASTTVSIEDASVPQGETVTVPINIADVENMCGANIWLNYEKDVVIVDSISDGDLVPLTHSIDNTAGVTKINWDTTSGMTGDFVFAYVTLKAVGNPGDTCLLDLDVNELYDCVPPFNEIPRTVAEGTFTVRANIVPKPDLIITEKWLCWPDNCTICYNVTNIGNGPAPACHNTTLYVDGVAVAHDHVPVDLAPGESYIGCFDGYTWQYTPPSDNITVCADNNETIDELNETNNCLTNTWMCGDVNGDRTVNVVDVVLIYKRALDPGYPLDLPWAGDVNCDRNINVIDVVLVYKRALDPGYDLNCCCEV